MADRVNSRESSGNVVQPEFDRGLLRAEKPFDLPEGAASLVQVLIRAGHIQSASQAATHFFARFGGGAMTMYRGGDIGSTGFL
jgi:hypothetical protein